MEDWPKELEVPDTGLFSEQVVYETPGGKHEYDVVIVDVIVQGHNPPALFAVHLGGWQDLSKMPSLPRLLDLAVAIRRARVRGKALRSEHLPQWDMTSTDVSWARGLRQRNRVTDQLLERTAELYLKDGAQAVADELCVSRRQASRYVKTARDRGLLA